MLLCPVRDCRLALQRAGQAPDGPGGHGRLLCARGHSFDVARSGYVNLLQPQDRRSRHPGDTAAAVAARRRLHDRGITAVLLEAIQATLKPCVSDTILDAGCGDGFYLGSLAAATGCRAHGVDIAIPAIDA